MEFWPDFSDDQKKELGLLGALPTQIAELRKALLTVRSVVARKPANTDVAAILGDIAKHAAALSKRLRGSVSTAKAHTAAFGAIAQRYWNDERVKHSSLDRCGHPGATVSIYLCPLLDALTDAAHSGIKAIPRKPVRHKAADPKAIKAIYNALVFGWPRNDTTTWIDDAQKNAAPVVSLTPMPPFPRRLRPSSSPTSAFSRIVGICYAAVEGNSGPERAIKVYKAQEKQRRADGLAAFSKGVAKVSARRAKR
jgi:hypothetical protein